MPLMMLPLLMLPSRLLRRLLPAADDATPLINIFSCQLHYADIADAICHYADIDAACIIDAADATRP